MMWINFFPDVACLFVTFWCASFQLEVTSSSGPGDAASCPDLAISFAMNKNTLEVLISILSQKNISVMKVRELIIKM